MKDLVASRDGIPIAFEAAGSGDRALVFVHGWSCDRSYWAAQTRSLAPRYRVVSIDLAGHGESGAGRPSWTIPAFGDDVAAVVVHLGLRDVVLVGHSMGGDVIVDAALQLGDRVRGLVWVDVYRSLNEAAEPDRDGRPDRDATPVGDAGPGADAGPDGDEEFLGGFRRDFVGATERFVRGFFLPTSDPVLVECVVADMASARSDIAIDALRHAIANEGPAIAGLRKLRAPIVAINPDYKPTDEASMLRCGVRVVTMTGVGHMLMLEDPERFDALLAGIVEGFT